MVSLDLLDVQFQPLFVLLDGFTLGSELLRRLSFALPPCSTFHASFFVVLFALSPVRTPAGPLLLYPFHDLDPLLGPLASRTDGRACRPFVRGSLPNTRLVELSDVLLDALGREHTIFFVFLIKEAAAREVTGSPLPSDLSAVPQVSRSSAPEANLRIADAQIEATASTSPSVAPSSTTGSISTHRACTAPLLVVVARRGRKALPGLQGAIQNVRGVEGLQEQLLLLLLLPHVRE